MVGNTDIKELILFFEYPPFVLFWAVPVFPPISNPSMLANDAVPCFVVTIFLKIGNILTETFSSKIFCLLIFSVFFIKLGLISYPPLTIIEYALANWSRVVVIPWPKEAVASGHLPQLNSIGLPTSCMSKLATPRIPIFDKKDLYLSIPIFWPILTEPILPERIRISSAVKFEGISSSYSLIVKPAQVKDFGKS